MRMLFAVPPGYGLMLPVVPLIWAARVAGHEVLVATTADMVGVGAAAGLPMYDVLPDRDVWDELMRAVTSKHRGSADDSADGSADDSAGGAVSEEFRLAARAGNPFGLFTLTMTEGTVAGGRDFGADLVVHTSDHAVGPLAALALGVPALDVGNRVSWSMRDTGFRTGRDAIQDDEVVRLVRGKLSIPEGRPRTVARIDPRAPSMGGLVGEEADPRDGAPWWAMRYVPFNGGAVVPDWALRQPDRPRVCVTLGTVVPAMHGVSSLAAVLDALAGLDVEVVLAAGTADLSELGELPANVRSVGFLALSAFLPTCSLIVHHGGSGTTATPLHYGVPQLVLPSFADNPMSAARVVERGVGLSHDPATATAYVIRELAKRLLSEPSFAVAAREVRAEMAGQPSPSSIIDKAAALV
ncbi:MAG TPA: nucleotide disphospho-sugar-binding domain-containing protein [Pseudonocardia sp.]|nr:nucleotide disphospho-sugar-binding domain-containing protein [Pseudonocardia sp.]